MDGVQSSSTVAGEGEVLEQQQEEVEQVDPLALALEEAEDLAALRGGEAAVPALTAVLEDARGDDEALRVKELAVYKLAQIYATAGRFADIIKMLRENNTYFGVIPKSRTAKVVRSIIDIVARLPDSLGVQIDLCRGVIEWCREEKRTFLRQRVDARLATLLFQRKETNAALVIVNALLSELKKLDDKQMLTETHLLESRLHHSLENIPKAKAALTASRSAANSIYVTPLLQAELDEMSGVLQCEEGDNTTAFSYFLEAFDAYDKSTDPRAVTCLKYMCLTKVLSYKAHEVPSILSNKSALKHVGPEIESMTAVARAATERSLEKFQTAVDTHAKYLRTDDLINHHLEMLYENMLEDNLLKIISPYSCVELSHVAQLIKLPQQFVEKKLSQMILDKAFSGILDQGKGHLIVFEPSADDAAFANGIDIISNVGLVVDALSSRAKNIHQLPAPKPVEEVKKAEVTKTDAKKAAKN